MRKHLWSQKHLFATAPAIVVALGFMATDVTAGSSVHHGKNQITSPVARSAVQRGVQPRRRLAGQQFVHRIGNLAPAYNAVRSGVPVHREPSYVYMPGYVYAPGKGILDEACNLPTSACPNEMRDAQ
jgi:hypothetical protein